MVGIFQTTPLNWHLSDIFFSLDLGEFFKEEEIHKGKVTFLSPNIKGQRVVLST